MPSEGRLFACGVISLFLFAGIGVALSVKHLIQTPLAITLVFSGIALLCVFANLGNLGSILLPGGLRAEFAANRAVAAKNEVVKLAGQVEEAKRDIERVHDEMRRTGPR